jgi:hypothetical protein
MTVLGDVGCSTYRGCGTVGYGYPGGQDGEFDAAEVDSGGVGLR